MYEIGEDHQDKNDHTDRKGYLATTIHTGHFVLRHLKGLVLFPRQRTKKILAFGACLNRKYGCIKFVAQKKNWEMLCYRCTTDFPTRTGEVQFGILSDEETESMSTVQIGTTIYYRGPTTRTG